MDADKLPTDIEQALERGSIVLTANQRAARTLRYDFDRQQHARGKASWQPPAIYAWDTWTAMLWQSLLIAGHASALLLNRSQEHTVWCGIIDSEGAAAAGATAGAAAGSGAGTAFGALSSLRSTDTLAEGAADAWLLLHTYQGRSQLHAYADSFDTRTFEGWAGEFDRRSARSNYLSAARLAEVLRAAVLEGLAKPASQGLLLVGFDTRTPAQTALLEAMRAAAGVSVEETEPTSGEASALVAAGDVHEELSSAARFLRARLTEYPGSRLGVIVPALADERAEIERVFRRILAPELDEIGAPAGSGPFEFSLGVPMLRAPIVATAFDLLRWAGAALPLDRITSLLLSPHFAPGSTDAEHLARAEFDAFVLRRGPMLQPELTLDRFYDVALQSRLSGQLPVLLRHVRALRTLLQRKDLLAGERSHADWATVIADILEAAGVSVMGRDTSVEFQTRRKWESLLDELASLDFDGRRCTYAEAIAMLQRMAAQTLFAPETRHAPVQILGPLEAAGSRFDAIWFLRAGDLSWPASAGANPMIPWRLQRELGMPGANQAQSTMLARGIMERIAASAPTVVFSYAAQTEDGERQGPSAALSGVALTSRPITEVSPRAAVHQPTPLERVEELVPIPAPPDRVLRGGAGILKAQAECGFRAFAEKRLFSTAVEEIDLGLSPRERGELVHTALERFWSEVQTQDALRHMHAERRDEVLARSIDHALAHARALSEEEWPTAYLNTERRRLLRLLGPWLDYEVKRPAFTVKSREETIEDAAIGPLRLSIRIDRIDVTADGGEIILDYKTGSAKPSAWGGERPEEPQLPLYAVLSKASDLAAVAFASVRAGKVMDLNGYQAVPDVLPKFTKLPAASLDAQVDEWRSVLTSLATAFHAGDARALPRQYPTTCKHCQQRLLCRLDPTSLSAAALEEFEDFVYTGGETDIG